MHYAVNGGHVRTAKYLLERSGALVSGQTKSGMTLVHAAVASGDMATVKYMLLKTKENVHIVPTKTGATVLHIASGQ